VTWVRLVKTSLIITRTWNFGGICVLTCVCSGHFGREISLQLIYFELFTFISSKNSLHVCCCPTLHFHIVPSQLMHLSYRGTGFLIPCWDNSVSSCIKYRATTIRCCFPIIFMFVVSKTLLPLCKETTNFRVQNLLSWSQSVRFL
jgi:hypothetical protein